MTERKDRISEMAGHVFTTEDIEACQKRFDEDLERIVEEKKMFSRIAGERVSRLREWEAQGMVNVSGSSFIDDGKACICLFLTYPDRTQHTVVYQSKTPEDAKKWLDEKKAVIKADWSGFDDSVIMILCSIFS